MADERTITWTGKSGTGYNYWIYPIGQSFTAGPGNYVFAKETTPNNFRPIYVGETADLSDRFDSHHKMDCIKKNGSTHIHVHASSTGADTRQAEEQDIIAKWNPICNG